MMSNPYRCDIITTLSLPYGFDIESISLRCRIHIVAMSNPYRNDNVVTISLPYGFDIEMITISTSNPYRCDVESISLRCRIHIETITSLRYRYHMDSTSK